MAISKTFQLFRTTSTNSISNLGQIQNTNLQSMGKYVSAKIGDGQ